MQSSTTPDPGYDRWNSYVCFGPKSQVIIQWHLSGMMKATIHENPKVACTPYLLSYVYRYVFWVPNWTNWTDFVGWGMASCFSLERHWPSNVQDRATCLLPSGVWTLARANAQITMWHLITVRCDISCLNVGEQMCCFISILTTRWSFVIWKDSLAYI